MLLPIPSCPLPLRPQDHIVPVVFIPIVELYPVDGEDQSDVEKTCTGLLIVGLSIVPLPLIPFGIDPHKNIELSVLLPIAV